MTVNYNLRIFNLSTYLYIYINTFYCYCWFWRKQYIIIRKSLFTQQPVPQWRFCLLPTGQRIGSSGEDRHQSRLDTDSPCFTNNWRETGNGGKWVQLGDVLCGNQKLQWDTPASGSMRMITISFVRKMKTSPIPLAHVSFAGNINASSFCDDPAGLAGHRVKKIHVVAHPAMPTE